MLRVVAFLLSAGGGVGERAGDSGEWGDGLRKRLLILNFRDTSPRLASSVPARPI